MYPWPRQEADTGRFRLLPRWIWICGRHSADAPENPAVILPVGCIRGHLLLWSGLSRLVLD